MAMASTPKNEGEGSRSGAKAYDDATRSFVEKGGVPSAAEAARRAVEGPERDELLRAEAEGKRHSKGDDPALRSSGEAVDFAAALLNPAGFFTEPRDVVADAT